MIGANLARWWRSALALTFCLAISSCTRAPNTSQASRAPRATTKTNPPLAIDLGTRPMELIASMRSGALKERLRGCQELPPNRTRFSIGHRGAPRHFPEHTRESYVAAAKMGAGLIECDVTLTGDGELVCRHSECDLHATTNILETELESRCSAPFSPADPSRGRRAAEARCCTTDLTFAEFKSLCGRMPEINTAAKTVGEYLGKASGTQKRLGSECPALVSHRESIELLGHLGVDFIPELKRTLTPRAAKLYTRRELALRLVEEYESAQIEPDRVFLQSFHLEDIRLWLEEKPQFGHQVVFLDGRLGDASFDVEDPATFSPSMAELRETGVRFIAPPIEALVRLEAGELVPTRYASEARRERLALIPWSLERSPEVVPAKSRTDPDLLTFVTGDENVFPLIHALSSRLGVAGIFSDWPASVSYYDNCLRQ